MVLLGDQQIICVWCFLSSDQQNSLSGCFDPYFMHDLNSVHRNAMGVGGWRAHPYDF